MEIVYGCDTLDLAFATGLEQWAGRALSRRETTANLLLRDRVLMLPREPAVELGDRLGWAAAWLVRETGQPNRADHASLRCPGNRSKGETCEDP